MIENTKPLFPKPEDWFKEQKEQDIGNGHKKGTVRDYLTLNTQKLLKSRKTLKNEIFPCDKIKRTLHSGKVLEMPSFEPRLFRNFVEKLGFKTIPENDDDKILSWRRVARYSVDKNGVETGNCDTYSWTKIKKNTAKVYTKDFDVDYEEYEDGFHGEWWKHFCNGNRKEFSRIEEAFYKRVIQEIGLPYNSYYENPYRCLRRNFFDYRRSVEPDKGGSYDEWRVDGWYICQDVFDKEKLENCQDIGTLINSQKLPPLKLSGEENCKRLLPKNFFAPYQQWDFKLGIKNPCFLAFNNLTGEIRTLDDIPSLNFNQTLEAHRRIKNFIFKSLSEKRKGRKALLFVLLVLFLKRFVRKYGKLRMFDLRRIINKVNTLDKKHGWEVVRDYLVEHRSELGFLDFGRENLLDTPKILNYVFYNYIRSGFSDTFFSGKNEDKDFNTLAMVIQLEEDKLGAALKENSNVLVVDIDNRGGDNAVQALKEFMSVYDVTRNDVIFCEYGYTGSRGFHVYIKLNQVVSNEQIKAFKKVVNKDFADKDYQIEIHDRKSNLALPLGTDYYPVNMKAFLDGEKDFLVSPSDYKAYFKVVAEKLNNEKFKGCEKLSEIISAVEEKTEESEDIVEIVKENPWKMNNKPTLRVREFSDDKRTPIKAIIKPLTLGNSYKERYKYIMSALRSFYSKEEIVQRILETANENGATARFYKEAEFNERYIGSLYDYCFKQKSQEKGFKAEYDIKSRENKVVATSEKMKEVEMRTPKKFVENIGYLHPSLREIIAGSGEFFLNEAISNLALEKKLYLEKTDGGGKRGSYILKSAYIHPVLKFLVPYAFECLWGKCLYDYRNPELVTTRGIEFFRKYAGFSVSHVYFESMLGEVTDKLFLKGEMANVNRKFVSKFLNEKEIAVIEQYEGKVRSFLKNTSIIKNTLLRTFELERVVNEKTGEYMYCSGQSQTVQLHNEKFVMNHFESILNKHLPNTHVKTALVNELNRDYMDDHIVRGKDQFEQYIEFGRANNSCERINLKIEQDKNRRKLSDLIQSLKEKGQKIGDYLGKKKWGRYRDADGFWYVQTKKCMDEANDVNKFQEDKQSDNGKILVILGCVVRKFIKKLGQHVELLKEFEQDLKAFIAYCIENGETIFDMQKETYLSRGSPPV